MNTRRFQWELREIPRFRRNEEAWRSLYGEAKCVQLQVITQTFFLKNNKAPNKYTNSS